MFLILTKFRFALVVIALLSMWGCIDMTGSGRLGQSPPPSPVATSLEQMPEDAAIVAQAIQKQCYAKNYNPIKHVTFTDPGLKLNQAWCSNDLVPAGIQLYTYQPEKDNLQEKTINGRFDFEGPFGRKASVQYNARFSSQGKEQLIEKADIKPIYSTLPKPVMFIVPNKFLPSVFPDSYAGMFQLVGEKALSYLDTKSTTAKSDYTIFVFFQDRISPSAKVAVKISNDSKSIYGYEKSTRYLDYIGWRVALISGKFTLSDNGEEPDLYVKAVFTPGKEGGIIRSPKLVGMFCLNETKS